MTEAAAAARVAGRGRSAPTSDKPVRRWSLPPPWLWPVSLVTQVVSAALLTSYTYYFVDDWIFLAQARTQPFSLTYLREGLFEHFSPVTRLLDKLLAHAAPASFTLAHAIQLGLYAAAIAAFAFTMVTILGNGWTAFVLTLLFGQSLFLLRLLNWWTATANILPATIFSLVTVAGYLRWRRGHSRRWLAVTLGAFVGAWLDYETALLLPAYLLAVAGLVLADELRPRAWARLLWQERAMWFGLAAVEVIALVNYYVRYYASLPHPTVGQTLHYLLIALPDTFVPALLAIKNPQTAIGRSATVIVVCCVLATGASALLISARPRAWRCLGALAVCALITMLPVGVNRIATAGVGIGHELYYEQSLQFMFFVLLALALAGPARTVPTAVSAAIARGWRRARSVPVLLGSAGAFALAGYAALYVSSVHAMARASWEPQFSRRYVNALRASVRAARERTGQAPVLIDGAVAPELIPPAFVPYNHYDEMVPNVEPGLRFDRGGAPGYVITELGRLLPVRFAAIAAGRLGRSTVTALPGVRVGPAGGDGTSPARLRAGSRDAACVPLSRSGLRLHVPLATALSTGPRALPYAVHLVVRMPRAAPGGLVLRGPAGSTADQTYPATWPRGRDDVFQPLSVTRRVSEIGLDLPAGACVESLALGAFDLAQSPR